jgi:hypothetical protein
VLVGGADGLVNQLLGEMRPYSASDVVNPGRRGVPIAPPTPLIYTGFAGRVGGDRDGAPIGVLDEFQPERFVQLALVAWWGVGEHLDELGQAVQQRPNLGRGHGRGGSACGAGVFGAGPFCLGLSDPGGYQRRVGAGVQGGAVAGQSLVTVAEGAPLDWGDSALPDASQTEESPLGSNCDSRPGRTVDWA